MKMKQLSAALALVMLGIPAFAVTPGADSPTAEGQKGVEQHDQSAGAKAQSTSTPSVSTTEEKKDESASSGASTAAPVKGEDRFTHGESARCASMTGADKDQCDREEATKTEGPAARDASPGGPQDSAK